MITVENQETEVAGIFSLTLLMFFYSYKITCVRPSDRLGLVSYGQRDRSQSDQCDSTGQRIHFLPLLSDSRGKVGKEFDFPQDKL